MNATAQAKMAASSAVSNDFIGDSALISVINRLQEATAAVGQKINLGLPRIVVVGAQSSGKSSVLETIVGREFLPRGSGIVTRRPLELQLIRIPAEVNGKPVVEWGEFGHRKGQRYTDFNLIRKEIEAETERVAPGDSVSNVSIRLQIYSPNVVDLTLVDLPGLTAVSVGNQRKSIVTEIQSMVNREIKEPNNIILAVSPGSSDIATSVAIQEALKVDPNSERTIGVLTKVDMMGEESDLLEVLKNRMVPLKLGYVPVVGRSQREIDNNKTIAQSLISEREFFATHRAYANRADYCGTPYLARKLNMILVMQIKQQLPALKERIATLKDRYSGELVALSDGVLEGSTSTVAYALINQFCNEFRTLLDGNSTRMSSSDLAGGARISYVFHHVYSGGIRAVEPFDQVTDASIRTVLYNSSGLAPALFVGGTAFQLIVKKQIARLEAPSLKCVDLVYDELDKILTLVLSGPMFVRYRRVQEVFRAVSRGVFKEALNPTRELVKNLVAMEKSYVNTAHPDFVSASRAMAMVSSAETANAMNKPVPVDPKTGKPIPQQNQQRSNSPSVEVEGGGGANNSGGFFGMFRGANKKKLEAMEAPPASIQGGKTLSARETQDVEVIKVLISSYFSIVRRTIIDTVPKAIMLCLVQFTLNNINAKLLEHIYKYENIDELTIESEATIQKRKELKDRLDVLFKAHTIVTELGSS